jgi:hypothetical protein
VLARVAAESDPQVRVVPMLERPLADLGADGWVVLAVQVGIAVLVRVRRIEEHGARTAPADVLALAEHALAEHALPVPTGHTDATQTLLKG